MDLYDGMLRVFSGPPWTISTQYLEIWDASNLDDLTLVDQEAFGEDETLFGAIFLDDRALATTYRHTGPFSSTGAFHAFTIDENGDATKVGEFTAPGWNHFLQPVLDGTRLIAIGTDDRDGTQLTISLYDITDVTNPAPLIKRQEIGFAGGIVSSQATWDPRAFTVVDDAVIVHTPMGETETGLVLLPFSTASDPEGSYARGVQILTYSASTLTRRDTMGHDTFVRRSFVASNNVAVNVSERELKVFSYTVPDEPREIGRLDVSPAYENVLLYENARIRRAHSPTNEPAALPRVEIVPRTESPDTAQPLASFELPDGARLYKMGESRLLVMTLHGGNHEPPYTADIDMQVYDVSSPQSPVLLGEYEAPDMPSPFQGYVNPHGYLQAIFVTDDAVAILQHERQELPAVSRQTCRTYVDNGLSECPRTEGCEHFVGSRLCQSIDGRPEFCEGSFARCIGENDIGRCEPVSLEDVADDVVSTKCGDSIIERQFRPFALHVIDFSDPANPTRPPVIPFGAQNEGVKVLQHGDTLYVALQKLVEVPDDPRPYVRHFVYPVDLSQPAQPVVGPPIDVPGVLLAVHGDTLYTRDAIWGAEFIEFAVVQSKLDDGVVRVERSHRFHYDLVSNVAIDGTGQVVVQHSDRWDVFSPFYVERRLTVLRPSPTAADGSFEVALSQEIPPWMQLVTAHGGLAYLHVYGGLLTLDLEAPGEPPLASFLPNRSWEPELTFDGDHVLITGAQRGIDEYDPRDPSLQVPQLPEAAE